MKVNAPYSYLIHPSRKRDFKVEDQDDMRNTLLIAARKNHHEIITYIFQEDSDMLRQLRAGNELRNQAIKEGLSSVFEVNI